MLPVPRGIYINVAVYLNVVRVDVEGGRAEEQLGGHGLPGPQNAYLETPCAP